MIFVNFCVAWVSWITPYDKFKSLANVIALFALLLDCEHHSVLQEL